MSATLWLNSDREETIELGPTLPMYTAFSDMAKAAGENYLQDWPALFSVPTATELQDDVDLAWLAEVKKEAGQFLERFGDKLSPEAQEILAQLKS